MPVLSEMDRVHYVTRAAPWLPSILACIIGAAVVAIQHQGGAAAPLEAVGILLASGAGFALDDTSAEILAASPTPLLRRRIARVLVWVPATALAWLALVLVQGPASPSEGWAFAAMFAGLLGLSLGIAGVASRRSVQGRGGLVVGPAIVVLLVASTIVPPRWRPLPLGDVPGGWTPIYLRWSAAAVVGILTFLWSSRDRAGRSVSQAISRTRLGDR